MHIFVHEDFELIFNAASTSSAVLQKSFDAPPAASPMHSLSGRYPGSQVLICRLPMIAHSGMMTNPHLLTVAGAA